ncbi:hypothetical protein [Treponema pedis]|uniref:hypothetical protein n=2 Tax=Treponema pedis TaxID=409322 RepID=UPI0012680CCA|nr:hypothetical protein [Treponema pedis]
MGGVLRGGAPKQTEKIGGVWGGKKTRSAGVSSLPKIIKFPPLDIFFYIMELFFLGGTYMSELLENLQSFREETSKSDNTRYYSWIDCNLVFRQKKTADDVLAKELFMFLASWGMLRNSFLLNHNRRILLPVINLLKDPRFKILQNASIDTVEANASLIITLKNELFSCLTL